MTSVKYQNLRKIVNHKWSYLRDLGDTFEPTVDQLLLAHGATKELLEWTQRQLKIRDRRNNIATAWPLAVVLSYGAMTGFSQSSSITISGRFLLIFFAATLPAYALKKELGGTGARAVAIKFAIDSVSNLVVTYQHNWPDLAQRLKTNGWNASRSGVKLLRIRTRYSAWRIDTKVILLALRGRSERNTRPWNTIPRALTLAASEPWNKESTEQAFRGVVALLFHLRNGWIFDPIEFEIPESVPDIADPPPVYRIKKVVIANLPLLTFGVAVFGVAATFLAK